MNDFKIKILLSVLSAVLFSFVMIMLALALPIHKKKNYQETTHPQNNLEKISRSLKKSLG